MSILEGEVLKMDERTSKAGKEYQRLLIKDDLGNEEWFSNFSWDQKAFAGDVIRCEMKPSKGDFPPFINSFELITPGDYSMRQQGATKPATNGASVPRVTLGKEAESMPYCEDIKQVYIQTSVYFQELYRSTMNDNQSGVHVRILDIALGMAMHTDRVLSAYKKGGESAADAAMGNPTKASREQLRGGAELGSPLFAESAEQQTQASQDVGSPEHPAFDGDIPF